MGAGVRRHRGRDADARPGRSAVRDDPKGRERFPSATVAPVTWRRVWCFVIGHKWQKKRSGGAAWLVCVRCGKERDAPDHVELTGG
jgi:hypothetical protein